MNLLLEFVKMTCPICNSEYFADPKRLKYGRQTTCSRKCSYEFRHLKNKVELELLICAHCGKRVEKLPCIKKMRKYCSMECYNLARAESAGYVGRLEKICCNTCGKEFKQEDREHKFCSRHCFEIAHKNRMLGDRNPSFIDGRSSRATYDAGTQWHEIRLSVYRRDKFTCQRCGVKCVPKNQATKETAHQIIQCHHINPYKESKDNSLGNLVTLCIRCHRQVHSKVENVFTIIR